MTEPDPMCIIENCVYCGREIPGPCQRYFVLFCCAVAAAIVVAVAAAAVVAVVACAANTIIPYSRCVDVITEDAICIARENCTGSIEISLLQEIERTVGVCIGRGDKT